MAIAFAHVSIHSRAKGHSSVAAAAYRSASKLLDERTGITHDFTKRKDVVFTEILLPETANDRFKERRLLWNSVELSEKRKDSQVCKDIVLALPKELDLTHQIDLTKRFAQTHFISENIPCDIAIHDHGDGNPHAHILISTRRLEAVGFSNLKARDLNPTFFSGSVVEDDLWGEHWRNCQNDFFDEHGLDVSVDLNHVISERHEGVIRDKENHYVRNENEIIKQERITIALGHADNIINHISSTHSVFTRRDVERLLFKTLGNDKSLSNEFTGLVERIIHHKDVIHLGPNDDGRDSFTTRNQYISESVLLKQVDSMTMRSEHMIHNNVDEFAKHYHLNDEQSVALNYIAKGHDLSSIVGKPGVGKSYLLKPLRDCYQSCGMRVLGAALSGKVSKALESETGIKSSTIASLTYRLSHNKLTLTQNDVIVIDEAGMVDFANMASIIDAAYKARSKVILIGDPNQLKPIHKGEIFKGILARSGHMELCNIRRQRDEGDRLASLLLSQGDIPGALLHYEQKNAIHVLGTVQDASYQLVQDWQENIHSLSDTKENAMFAFTRSAVFDLNHHARAALQETGMLSTEEFTFARWVDKESTSSFIEPNEIKIAVGERIMLRKNDKSIGVRNGDFALVESYGLLGLVARLDSGETVTIPKSYHHIDYGYATTVHKGQGMTVDNAKVLIDSKYWDKFLAFVAMTRHRDNLNLYLDSSQHPDMDTLKKTLSRSPTKDNVIDWPLDFAIRAGFDPDTMLGRALNHIARVGHNIKDKWNYVVNYEECIKQRAKSHQLEDKQIRRAVAKKAADYIDTQCNFSRLSHIVEREAREQNVNKSAAPSFEALYLEGLHRDKQAHHLWAQHANQLSGVSIDKFKPEIVENAAKRYSRYLIVKAIASSINNSPDEVPMLVKQSIDIDNQRDFSHIKREAKKINIEPEMLIKHIELYQKAQRKIFYEVIKKEYPDIANYGALIVRRKSLHGYDAAQVDKQLLAMARRIVKDRELYTKLKQQLPNLAVGLSKRIEHALKKDRGIDR